MTFGQLDPETRAAWWVRETRVSVTADGEIIYDPKLWWPMEILKRVGRAWRMLGYSATWRSKTPKIQRGDHRKVRTYRKEATGFPWIRRMM